MRLSRSLRTVLLVVLRCAYSVGLASASTLTHGPVFGGVTSTAASVFVRTDVAANVVVQYSTDPTLANAQSSESYATAPTDDYTVHVALNGLTSETTYYVDVLIDGVSQFGGNFPSFTTFATAGEKRDFNFVVLTDFETVSNLTSPVQTFASAANEHPAFVLLGGDFDHRNPSTVELSRAMYRDLYNANTPNMDGFVPLVLRHFPVVHQWDDHDSGLNNVDKNYPNWANNQQVYQEYMPSYPLPAVTPGTWQSFGYAQADFFVLDCRSQRDNAFDPDDGNKSMLDGNALGASGQLQWLENGLLHSTARWKVIFTSVTANPTTKANDGWAAYQTEWTNLRNFVAQNNVQGVVLISGDLHLAAIDDGTYCGFPEMCVPQPNGNTDGSCPTDMYGVWSQGYYDGTCTGYGVVTITQDPDTLTLADKDEFGVTHLSYTIDDSTLPPPTPTPSPTPTPTPTPPVITRQPMSQTVFAGTTATFRVTAKGSGLQYQWSKSGFVIPRSNRSAYTTPPTLIADNGSVYSVTVTNQGGGVTSSNAILTVLQKDGAPQITKQPADQKVLQGRSATFTVSTSGSDPRAYQWRKNGVNIQGAQKPIYRISSATLDQSGSRFSVTVSNSQGTVTSRSALLTVTTSQHETEKQPARQIPSVNLRAIQGPPAHNRWHIK